MKYDERHSISIEMLRYLVASAARNGRDVGRLMQAGEINPELLNNDGFRLTPPQLTQVVRQIWTEWDDELLGLASHPLKFGVFQLMAEGAVRCKDLEAVYRHLTRFYNLVTDAVSIEFECMGGEARFSLQLKEPDRDPEYFLVNYLLLIWHRFPSWLTGQRLPLEEVCLTHGMPRHAEEYRYLFPCPVRFNKPLNCFVFKSEYLDRLVLQSEEGVEHLMRRAPLDWFTRQAYFANYTRQVLDLLEEATAQGEEMPSMDSVAKHFNMTTRTLRRKLASENMRFQTLRDQTRRDMAIHYLTQLGMSVGQVSQRLGYSEPTAFVRAFTHWTGVSPGKFRFR